MQITSIVLIGIAILLISLFCIKTNKHKEERGIPFGGDVSYAINREGMDNVNCLTSKKEKCWMNKTYNCSDKNYYDMGIVQNPDDKVYYKLCKLSLD